MNAIIEKLKTSFAGGRINRREFMMQAIAAGATVSTASMLADKALAATPKRGGDVKLGISNANMTDSFDPQVTPAFMMLNVRTAVHDTLFEVASDMSIKPSLAESWDASNGAKIWQVKLKKGVEFHNGKTVTVEDVVNSVNLHLGEDSKSGMKTVMAHMDSVKADGDSIIFTLNQADADWPAVLSEYMLSILPTKDGAADWASMIGCGPYTLDNFDPGVSANVRRFGNDHRDDRGWFESVEFVGINDGNARVNAVTTGSVHASSRITPVAAKLLQRKSGINLVNRTGPGFYVFQMHTGLEPTSDANVRMALKHAINREEFVQKILSGFGTVGNDQPIGPTYTFYAGLEQRTYDPDAAKSYLKKAGLSSLELEIHGSDGAFEGSVDAASLLNESAKKAGMSLQPVRAPADGYWSNTWGKVPVFAGYWTGRPTEAGIISIIYGSGAGWNATGYANAQLDDLVAQARGELDLGRRRELYREAQLILRDDGPSIIPAFYNVVDAVSTKIGVPESKVSGSWFEGRYAASRWWFV